MYPAYYEEIAALDKQRDIALKVLPVSDYSFARKECVLPAFTDEIAHLVSEYPVVFTTHETPVMVAVFGSGGNGYVDENGAWRPGVYIPAVVRAYPFAALPDGAGNIVFCIDRTYKGLNHEEGETVFANGEGGLTPFGEKAATFVQAYANSFERTAKFTRRLKELGLLTPVNVAVEKQGKRYDFTGLQQVDAAKLPALPADTLQELIGSGMLYAAHLHLYSLNNFNRIV